MRTNLFSFFFLLAFFLISANADAQGGNFDETWKEFLENNKISNMSELMRPDKAYEPADYAKYLLMNANTDFCQSDVDIAEDLLNEIKTVKPSIIEGIKGFEAKAEDLSKKIKAYYSMDALWVKFLETEEINTIEMENITAAKSTCEKSTLAKYSYMTAHYNLCRGDVNKAKDIFENRTLRLTEKTSLRVDDVKGLAENASQMKRYFQELEKLDAVWNQFVKTGESQGYDEEMSLYPCYPVPNMKILVLQGAANVCNAGEEMLAQIEKLEEETGFAPKGELATQIRKLKTAVNDNNSGVAALNVAWKAFLPDNTVKHMGKYGYEYCDGEDLIRAYIMDGFALVCEMAADRLDQIDEMQRTNPVVLSDETFQKLNELAALNEQYRANGVQIEMLWKDFVAQGDTLYQGYQSEEFYCDNILQIKDWTMQGYAAADCERAKQYLEQIDDFQRRFEFSFYEELECRVQNLRHRIWTCRYDIIKEIAALETDDGTYEDRLEKLMTQYEMGERPEVCVE